MRRTAVYPRSWTNDRQQSIECKTIGAEGGSGMILTKKEKLRYVRMHHDGERIVTPESFSGRRDSFMSSVRNGGERFLKEGENRLDRRRRKEMQGPN